MSFKDSDIVYGSKALTINAVAYIAESIDVSMESPQSGIALLQIDRKFPARGDIFIDEFGFGAVQWRVDSVVICYAKSSLRKAKIAFSLA